MGIVGHLVREPVARIFFRMRQNATKCDTRRADTFSQLRQTVSFCVIGYPLRAAGAHFDPPIPSIARTHLKRKPQNAEFGDFRAVGFLRPFVRRLECSPVTP